MLFPKLLQKMARIPADLLFFVFVSLASVTASFIPQLEGPAQFVVPPLFAIATALVWGQAQALFLVLFTVVMHTQCFLAWTARPEYMSFTLLAGLASLLLLHFLAVWRVLYLLASCVLALVFLPIIAINSYELIINAPLPTDVLLSLIETNFREASGFVQQNILLYTPLLAAPLLVALFLSFRRRFAVTGLAFTSDTRILVTIALGLGLLSTGPAVRVVIYGAGLLNYDAEAFAYQAGHAQRIANIPALGMKMSRNDKDALTIVVVGESASRHHLGLYGYDRQTTPRMAALPPEQLIVFPDVISSASVTHFSLTRALTTADVASGKRYYTPQTPTLFELLRSAGVSTAWISNQKAHGLWGQAITDITAHANQVFFSTADKRDSRKSRLLDTVDSNKMPPDEILLPELFKAMETLPRPAVIFVHLMGSHIQAGERYPDAFKIFNGKRQDIDEYDNSVLYTDHLLALLIERLEKDGHANSLLYFSDHGESVEARTGHDPARYDPNHVEIPFMLWLAPAFAQQHPDFAARAAAGRNNPFMLDALPQAVMDLAGVQGPYYTATKSPFSSQFEKTPRRTMEGKVLYDTNGK